MEKIPQPIRFFVSFLLLAGLFTLPCGCGGSQGGGESGEVVASAGDGSTWESGPAFSDGPAPVTGGGGIGPVSGGGGGPILPPGDGEDAPGIVGGSPVLCKPDFASHYLNLQITEVLNSSSVDLADPVALAQAQTQQPGVTIDTGSVHQWGFPEDPTELQTRIRFELSHQIPGLTEVDTRSVRVSFIYDDALWNSVLVQQDDPYQHVFLSLNEAQGLAFDSYQGQYQGVLPAVYDDERRPGIFDCGPCGKSDFLVPDQVIFAQVCNVRAKVDGTWETIHSNPIYFTITGTYHDLPVSTF